MSSNYNAGNANHRNDDGYEYLMGGVKIANVQTFPSTFSTTHEYMKFRYRTSRDKYEDLDSELDLLPNSSLLSAYRNDHELNHQHHIQQQSHYNHLQQQQHQQYRDHQHHHYYNVNLDKHASLHTSRKISPPPTSVQQHHGNSQNNNYQATGDRFIEDTQPQPTWESSRLR